MKRLKHPILFSKSKSQESARINTTLYDLLDALNYEVKEEKLVIQIVSDWIDAGQLKYIHAPKRNKMQGRVEVTLHP